MLDMKLGDKYNFLFLRIHQISMVQVYHDNNQWPQLMFMILNLNNAIDQPDHFEKLLV